MIIEYAGLPASGKSTLRTALLSLRGSTEVPFHNREVLQQQVIANLIPLDRSGPLRRLSTAGYKLMLGVRAKTNEATRLTLSELSQVHLVRAAQRLVESKLLFHHAHRLHDEQQAWFDLNEGICQNFISLQVWRRLLKPKNVLVSYDWLENHFETSPHILVILDLSYNVAVERLNARGRPRLWPQSIPSDEILHAYDEELATVHRLLQRKQLAVTALPVDAAIPEKDWPITAQTLEAQIIELRT